MTDLFIYRIMNKSWYSHREFRTRHERFFERNIQLVLYEFADVWEKIWYKEEVLCHLLPVKFPAWKREVHKRCMFTDSCGNIICSKILSDNDLKWKR